MKECSVCAAAAAAAAWAKSNGNAEAAKAPPANPPATVNGANGDVIKPVCNGNGGGSGGGGSSSGGGVRRVTRQGRCKWFNVAKGWGFITPDDGGQDVFVHQSVIQMPGFRSLGDDEVVEFECLESEQGLEATRVSGPSAADCQGSQRRPIAKKRFRKLRCYNCGEFANHIASKCTVGPQPKKCHNCKSEDHLIADCPVKVEKSKTDQQPGSSQDSPQGSSAKQSS